MIPRVCKIEGCGKPGAIFTCHGITRQRHHCDEHWRDVCKQGNAAKRQREVALRESSVPDGWQPSTEYTGARPERGVVRLTITHTCNGHGRPISGQVRFERGSLMRIVPLKHPQVWERLAGVFLVQGYHFVSEGQTTLVLERKENEHEPQH